MCVWALERCSGALYIVMLVGAGIGTFFASTDHGSNPICDQVFFSIFLIIGTTSNLFSWFVTFMYFYARQYICYSAYMLSPVRLSVRLSVRRVDHRKTVEVRIMKFSPYGSPIHLVFAGYVSSRNSKGFPPNWASNKRGVGKISSFLSLSVNISKTIR